MRVNHSRRMILEYQMQLRKVVILMNCNVQVSGFFLGEWWCFCVLFGLAVVCCFNDDAADVFFFISHEQFLFIFICSSLIYSLHANKNNI